MTVLHRRYVDLVDGLRLKLVSKKGFLDAVDNKFFGGSGLEVCVLKKLANGDRKSTTWKRWQEVRDNDWWVENINQRTICPCEVVFDIEEKKHLLSILAKLEYHHVDFLPFMTGSRGVHVHAFSAEAMRMSNEHIKEWFIDLGSDIMKASNRTMIALEYAPHWKTGKIKEVMPYKRT